MTATTAVPRLVTTVDQHVGTHAATGLRETRLVEIVTQYSDYAHHANGARWDDLSVADQAWWDTELTKIHDARVALAALDADHRKRAEAELIATERNDVDTIAEDTRRAITTTV